MSFPEFLCSNIQISGRGISPRRQISRFTMWFGPGLISKNRLNAKQSSSVFNQLPRFPLERVFGRRSALFSG
jgi:hypothetical protein